MSDLKDLKLSGYSRLPASLLQKFPELNDRQHHDKYGVEERLSALKHVLGKRDLGEAVDFGGNAGFFCLSLMDAGIIKKATVYDLRTHALADGRGMARLMGLDGRIEFKEQAIDIDFIRNHRPVDTIICLNLLHHAGSEFDVERIKRDGWEPYAREWLTQFASKASVAILGLGFEMVRPPNWDTPHPQRPARFAQMAKDSGWSLIYDANVMDIQKLGVEPANGRYTTGGMLLDTKPRPMRNLLKHVSKHLRLKSVQQALNNRRRKYHLYIFERDGGRPR